MKTEPENTDPDMEEMTLRDYFAGQALAKIADGVKEDANVAKWAYQLADAMIKERGRK